MSEKYIELKPQIVSDYALVGATAVQGGVGIALEWLDRHSDQVPGRTITESKYKKHTQYFSVSEVGAFNAGLHAAGVTVAPDPEPTNAERITADLEEWGVFRSTALELGPWLAGQGWVKALGGES